MGTWAAQGIVNLYRPPGLPGRITRKPSEHIGGGTWLLDHLFILPLRLSLHAALLAPVCPGAVNYALWKSVVTLLPPVDSRQVLLLVCVASATSFWVTFFVCGLAGGYGPSALDEFARAAQMCTFRRGMARAMSWCAHAGARLSPLRPPDPVWRDEAYREAAELDAAAVR